MHGIPPRWATRGPQLLPFSSINSMNRRVCVWYATFLQVAYHHSRPIPPASLGTITPGLEHSHRRRPTVSHALDVLRRCRGRVDSCRGYVRLAVPSMCVAATATPSFQVSGLVPIRRRAASLHAYAQRIRPTRCYSWDFQTTHLTVCATHTRKALISIEAHVRGV